MIARAYGSSVLGVASGLLTNFILLRLLATRIPKAEFGAFAIASQLTSYLANLQLGLDFAVSRQIAECRGRGDAETANSSYWELRRFNRIVMLVALVALILAVVVVVLNPRTSAVPAYLVPAVLAGFGCVQLLYFAQRPYSSALIGSEQQVFTNLLTVARTIASTLLATAVVLAIPTILAVPAAEIGTQALALWFMRRRFRSACSWQTIQRPPRNRQILRSLLGFGIPVTLGGLAWTIESTCDLLILGAVSGASTVALYVLWWRFPQMFCDLCTRLTTSAFPEFARAHGASVAHVRRIFDKVAYASIGLSSLAAVGVALWLPAFMRLWLGERYTLADGAPVARFCGALVLIRVAGNLLGMFQMAGGRAILPAALSWAQAAVKVAVALALAPRMGIRGVLIASCAASMVQVVGNGWIVFARGYADARTLVDTVPLLAAAAAVILLVRIPAHWGALLPFAIGVNVTVLLWASVWFSYRRRSVAAGILRRVIG